jgi:hypothetical protein
MSRQSIAHRRPINLPAIRLYRLVQTVSSKYLYLNKIDYTLPWLNGGNIPLSTAKRYLSFERSGTNTPDELIQRLDGTASSSLLNEFFRPATPGANISITSTAPAGLSLQLVDGRGNILRQGTVNCFTSRHIEGYILCLSNHFSDATLKRLGKTCCIRVMDVEGLCAILSDRLQIAGTHAKVEYTSNGDRNPFLKSIADAWMDEYRLYFPANTGLSTDSVWASIPAGIAERL